MKNDNGVPTTPTISNSNDKHKINHSINQYDSHTNNNMYMKPSLSSSHPNHIDKSSDPYVSPLSTTTTTNAVGINIAGNTWHTTIHQRSPHGSGEAESIKSLTAANDLSSSTKAILSLHSRGLSTKSVYATNGTSTRDDKVPIGNREIGIISYDQLSNTAKISDIFANDDIETFKKKINKGIEKEGDDYKLLMKEHGLIRNRVILTYQSPKAEARFSTMRYQGKQNDFVKVMLVIILLLLFRILSDYFLGFTRNVYVARSVLHVISISYVLFIIGMWKMKDEKVFATYCELYLFSLSILLGICTTLEQSILIEAIANPGGNVTYPLNTSDQFLSILTISAIVISTKAVMNLRYFMVISASTTIFALYFALTGGIVSSVQAVSSQDNFSNANLFAVAIIYFAIIEGILIWYTYVQESRERDKFNRFVEQYVNFLLIEHLRQEMRAKKSTPSNITLSEEGYFFETNTQGPSSMDLAVTTLRMIKNDLSNRGQDELSSELDCAIEALYLGRRDIGRNQRGGSALMVSPRQSGLASQQADAMALAAARSKSEMSYNSIKYTRNAHSGHDQLTNSPINVGFVRHRLAGSGGGSEKHKRNASKEAIRHHTSSHFETDQVEKKRAKANLSALSRASLASSTNQMIDPLPLSVLPSNSSNTSLSAAASSSSSNNDYVVIPGSSLSLGAVSYVSGQAPNINPSSSSSSSSQLSMSLGVINVITGSNLSQNDMANDAMKNMLTMLDIPVESDSETGVLTRRSSRRASMTRQYQSESDQATSMALKVARRSGDSRSPSPSRAPSAQIKQEPIELLWLEDKEDAAEFENVMIDWNFGKGGIWGRLQGIPTTRIIPKMSTVYEERDSVHKKIQRLSESGSKDEIRTSETQSNDIENAIDVTSSTITFPHFQAHPLAAITVQALRSLGLFESGLGTIDNKTVCNYMLEVEKHYLPEIQVPYHNRLHGCDVVQTVFSILHLDEAMLHGLADISLLALIIGAAVHDIGHPGLNNSYHVNTRSELAIRYNDRSVLENFHASTAISLLHRKELNFLSSLPPEQDTVFRNLIIDMILATDLANHFENLSHFDSVIATRKTIDFTESADNELVCSMILHGADIGCVAKDWEVYQPWVCRLFEEFYRQGDDEKKRGLNVVALFDRTKGNPSKAQKGFIKVICMPMFKSLEVLLPKTCSEAFPRMQKNLDMMESEDETLFLKDISQNQSLRS